MATPRSPHTAVLFTGLRDYLEALQPMLRRLRQAEAAHLGAADLTPAQFSLVCQIGAEVLPLASLKFGGAAISAAIHNQLKILVDKGLVSRTRSISDARAVDVRLTPAGLAIYTRYRAALGKALIQLDTGVNLAERIDETHATLQRAVRLWSTAEHRLAHIGSAPSPA